MIAAGFGNSTGDEALPNNWQRLIHSLSYRSCSAALDQPTPSEYEFLMSGYPPPPMGRCDNVAGESASLPNRFHRRLLFPGRIGTGMFPEHKQLDQFLGIKRCRLDGRFFASDAFRR